MARKPAIGGESGFVRSIFIYTEQKVIGPIQPGNYWTEFGSTDKNNISRMTGQPVGKYKFRYELRINDTVINTWFSNEATKMMPGLPPADEYKNLQPIQTSHLDEVILK